MPMMPVIAGKGKKQSVREQDKPEQRAVGQVRIPGVAWAAWVILMVVSALVGIGLGTSGVPSLTLGLVVTAVNLLGLWVLFALKVADQWEKGVMLRLGRFTGRPGPGLFWILPVVDRVSLWIDHRVTVTSFSAEKTPTKDTVPVDVDAVLFWLVWDAEKAALEVEDYRMEIAWAAQTALREVLVQMDLADILVGRGRMDRDLQKIIDERTTPWGVTVQSVEIRDVVIPQDLEDAMSRQAQAARERQARVILGESEKQIAQSFADASQAYRQNPTALHLRAMNMLFEGLKEKGALVIVPSSAVDTMNLGGLMGMASVGRGGVS